MWTNILKVVVALSLVYGIYALGKSHGVAVTEVKWEKVETKRLKEIAQLKDKVLKVQQESANRVIAISNTFNERSLHAKLELEKTISDLRSDNGVLQRQLRKRFKPTTCVSADATTGDSGEVIGEATHGLLREDQEFLIRLGDECDLNALNLIATQDLLLVYKKAALQCQ
jgi:hypothetical protein